MRRQLLLIVLIGMAPVIASYVAYYVLPRDKQVNYGTLHATAAPPVAGERLDGTRFSLDDLKGKWVIVSASGGECDARCTSELYASRQARTIQNAERERVQRVWVVTDAAPPSPSLLSEHPDLLAVRASPATVAALPSAGRDIYLVDPRGNLVLSWPADPDIKRMAADLARLLRASSIG
ncbi:MAG TPA: cytochrome C oxidase subunit I [Casimicrobiaceae bacterium]